MIDAPYDFYYWPTIPGRGEFVRLALEDAGVPYRDVARLSPKEGGGVPAMMKLLGGHASGLEPFAPPFLHSGALRIAQTANILQYVAPRHGLVPANEDLRVGAHQLQLSVADLVDEVHDTHHPVASGLYYEDQKPEALRRADGFTHIRLPKFLSYFERVLTGAGGQYMIGGTHTYVDGSIFHLLAGLHYAFPNAMARLDPTIPRLTELAKRTAERPGIAAYLASTRRLAFNEQGVFRHYPELDG